MRLPTLILSGALLLGACAPTLPVPDWKLATIPVDKKEQMRAAKEELDDAMALTEQADQTTRANEKFIDLAKAELELAKAQKEVAKAHKETADATGKANEIALAQKDITIADLQLAAAALKLDYANAEAEYTEKEKGIAEFRLQAAKDNYELTKLKILEENGALKDAAIKDPEKVKSRAAKSTEKYNTKKADFDGLRKKRDDLKNQYDAALAKFEAAKSGAPDATKTPTTPGTPESNPANPTLKQP